jgi:hypothetical protein
MADIEHRDTDVTLINLDDLAARAEASTLLHNINPSMLLTDLPLGR